MNGDKMEIQKALLLNFREEQSNLSTEPDRLSKYNIDLGLWLNMEGIPVVKHFLNKSERQFETIKTATREGSDQSDVSEFYDQTLLTRTREGVDQSEGSSTENLIMANKFTEEKDRYLFSDVLKVHQKHPTGFENLTKYMAMYNLKTEDYNTYIKNTQELQTLCLKTAIEAQRRSMPYCMGTLLWQFNDCNPVISWSILDYYGKPKPSLGILKA